MNNKLNFIKTDKSFKYSVNIKFDIGDIEKLNNYIPTKRSVNLFRELFESFDINTTSRAHLLTGSYGTGKSLFATILGTIISNKENFNKYDNFLEKINRYDNNLYSTIDNELRNKNPYLIILPSTDNKTFKKSMLLSLKKALKENDIEDIFPSTYFDAVLEKLNQWKKEFEETYKEFERHLMNDKGENIDNFIKKINNYDQSSYEYFEKIYPKLTSGGNFDSFYGCDLNEIYQSVNREIKKKGFQGIYIIFDEFNKLLEDNIVEFDGKNLQDFAEMATRSKENEIHLLLISHKNLIQYTSSLEQQKINEWKKIEGRFKILNASQYSSEIYELMSNVIIKEKPAWDNYKNSFQQNFQNMFNQTKKLDIFPEHDNKSLEENIIKGCYPLHPLATALLPDLSQKIAQNQRTIFTFLSTNENNTLGEFIREKHQAEFPLVNLPLIYDYFQDLMQKEPKYSKVHEAWLNSQRALEKINKNNDDTINMIKSLAIIQAVNNFNRIPPNKEILKFAINFLDNREFEKVLNYLLDNKIIIHRKSADQFNFFDGSEIDFDKKINEKIKQFNNRFSPKNILQKYFSPSPIYPKKYNFKYKIKRYFLSEYMTIDELKSVNNINDLLIRKRNNKRANSKLFLDGLIIYLVLNSKQEINEAKRLVEKHNNNRIIYVIPKEPLEIRNLLLNLNAQMLLKEDKNLLSEDPIAEKELDAYIDETKNIIDNKLTKFIEPYFENAVYYYLGEVQTEIKTAKNLSQTVSEICMEIFNQTPKINNELIVKNKITSPQKKARIEILNKLLFKNHYNERLSIDGYGPEFLIYRTMLIKTNLLIEKNNKLIYNIELNKNIEEIDKDNELSHGLKEILFLIYNEVYNSEGIVNFENIYEKLRTSPYGLRLGIIPILIVVAGKIDDSIKNVIIKHNDEEKEINAQLFDKINKYPSRYTLERVEWDNTREKYISFLEDIFNRKEVKFDKINRIKRLYSNIKNWYYSLPKFSREIQNISKESLLIRKIINNRNSRPNRILLKIIPKKLLENDLSKENIDDLNKYINKFFKEHQNAIKSLKYELTEQIINIFGNERKESNLINILNGWYNQLSENAKNHTYDKETNIFLNILRSIEEKGNDELINELTHSLSGFHLEDWNNDTKKDFIKNLTNIKEKIDQINKNKNGNEDYDYQFILYDDKNEKQYKRNFKETELEGLAKVLENRIESSFEDIGQVISDKEKQQILIKLLKKLF